MAVGNESKYFVVKFIQLPFEDVDAYVCVPNSWIKAPRAKDSKVLVAYPQEEDPIKTRSRSEKDEPCGENWKYHLAIVKYDSDDYEDAVIWMTLMDDDEPAADNPPVTETNAIPQDANDSTAESTPGPDKCMETKMELEGNQIIQHTKRKILNCNQNALTNPEFKKPLMEVGPLRNDQNFSIKVSHKQEFSINVGEETCHKGLRNDLTIDLATEESHNASESCESLTQKQLFIFDQPSIMKTNRKITMSDMQIPTNTSGDYCIAPVLSNQQCLSTPSEERESFDRIANSNTCSQNSQEPTRLMALQTQLTQSDNNYLMINENSPGQELINTSTQVIDIVQKNDLPNVIQRTVSEREMSTSITHSGHQVSDLSHRQQPFEIYKHNPQAESEFIGTTEIRSVNKNVLSEGVKKNLQTLFQSIPNVINHHQPCLVTENTRINQHIPGSIIMKQSDSNIGEAMIRPDKIRNDQKARSPNTTQISSTFMQSSYNKEIVAFQIPEDALQEKIMPSAYKTSSQQDPRIPNTFTRATTERTSFNTYNYAHYNSYRRPPSPYCVSENYSGQLSQPLLECHYLAALHNYPQEVPRMQTSYARVPTAVNNASESSKTQNTTKYRPHIIPNKSTNIANHSSKYFHNSNDIQFSPIEQQYKRKDPRTQKPFVCQSSEIKSYDLSNCIQSTCPTNSSPFSTQNITSSNNKAQPAQFSGHLQENQFTQDPRHRSNQDPQQKVLHRHPISMAISQTVHGTQYENIYLKPPPQTIPNNTPPVIDNCSNLVSSNGNVCLYTQKNQSLYPVQNHSNHYPRLQQTEFKRLTEKNIVTEIETRRSAIQHTSNTTNQLCPTSVNTLETRCSPVIINSTLKELQDMAVTKYIDVQSTTQNIENSQNTIQSHHNMANEMAKPHEEVSLNCVNILGNLTSVENGDKDISKCPEVCMDSSKIHVYSTKANTKISTDTPITEQILLNNFSDFFKNMDTTFRDMKTMSYNTRKSQDTFQKILKKVSEYCEMKIHKGTKSTPIDLKVSNSDNNNKDLNYKRKRDINVKKYCLDGDENNIYVDVKETYEVKQIKRPKTSFVLPFGYKSHDSKWTLKYRHAAPGTVELIPNSRVFIKASKLAKCKEVAKDCSTLGRMLLTDIFNKKALSVCSLTGAGAKDPDGTDGKLGLDNHAIMTLLTFVEEYGKSNGWSVNAQSTISSMHSKMEEFRKERSEKLG